MNVSCDDHSRRTGKRCAKALNHHGDHDFSQLCICGGKYCSGVPRRIKKGTHPQATKVNTVELPNRSSVVVALRTVVLEEKQYPTP